MTPPDCRDAADVEPVFWLDGAGPSTPDDEFAQPDAAESLCSLAA